ncbi:MAG: hypothetical protein KDD22_06465, partial [Bdellovibrionales bacterium]|nr:hypothetical protein [Bdellovibrionales bacterium]
NHIPLFLESKKLRKLVMKIKTDSQPPEVPKDPNDSLVFTLFTEFASSQEIEDLRAHYQRGIGWGEAKEILFQKVDTLLGPAREIYQDWMNRTEDLDLLLKKGSERARDLCAPLMADLRKTIGLS